MIGNDRGDVVVALVFCVLIGYGATWWFMGRDVFDPPQIKSENTVAVAEDNQNEPL